MPPSFRLNRFQFRPIKRLGCKAWVQKVGMKCALLCTSALPMATKLTAKSSIYNGLTIVPIWHPGCMKQLGLV